MTQPTTPSVPPQPGNRARATERPSRCMRPKVDSGKPCKREAGSGTDHWGEGPCVLHDDGTWTSERESFADNVDAQEQFLEAVLAKPDGKTRELIEATGYHRRDVAALAESNEEFRLRLEEARGEDPDAIRREWKRRAIECESDRMLELWVKTKLPEGAILRQHSTRLDGQVDVRAMPVIDASRYTPEEMADLLRLLEKGSPAEGDLPRDGRPALELVAGNGAT